MRDQESGYRSVQYRPVVSGPRIVGVVGARSLTYQHADHVGQIVDDLLARGNRIATGGAIGTDEYVLCRLLRSGQSDHCTVFAAWKGYDGFPAKVRAAIRQFKDYGGHIVWGPAGKSEPMVKTALLMRNVRLVDARYGLVAFITPDSRGTLFTRKNGLSEGMRGTMARWMIIVADKLEPLINLMKYQVDDQKRHVTRGETVTSTGEKASDS